MARNAVMLAHMEMLPPDIISLRRNALPASWSNDKQDREMQVPLWLLGMIHRCLEKDPAKRFKNGNELQEFIHLGSVSEERKNNTHIPVVETSMFHIDESIWKKEIQKLQTQLAEKDELLNDLQQQVTSRDQELYQAKHHSSKRKGISKSVLFAVLLIAFGVAGFTAYNKIYHPVKPVQTDTAVQVNKPLIHPVDSSAINAVKPIKKLKTKPKKSINTISDAGTRADSANNLLRSVNEYKIIRTTYFYNSPDYSNRSDAYLTEGDATLKVLEEANEFVHVIFINGKNKTTKGWLLKKDFTLANEY